MRNLKSEFLTRVRLPAFFLKRLVINILGNAGPRFKGFYLTSSRIFAESELKWLNSRGIGETGFHELMTLYPTLQRVLYNLPDWLPPAVSVHRGDWKLIRLFHGGEKGGHRYM